MHLVLIINSLGIGGAERVLVRLAHSWAKSGHKISFITFFQEENFFYQLDNKDSKINLINLGEQKPPNNQNCIQYFFKVTKRAYLLRKLFNTLQPDLIVSFLVGVNITVLLANMCSKIPVVVSERIDPNKHVIPEFYKKLRLLMYPQAAAIVVQTKGIADYFPEKYQRKIVIIPNFIKQPKIKKNIYTQGESQKQKIKNIIAVGRLHEQKDHKTLIYAFAKLVNNYPDLTLNIYGEGPGRGELQNLIINLNLQNRAFLPGITMDVENTLVTGDLFVFPSVYEGFSNALCEAMSCGLPVIASNCSGNVDIIENGVNGLLFKCGDVEELASLIQKLLNNSEHCNKLASNATNIVNRFSEIEILKLWDNVLEFASSCRI